MCLMKLDASELNETVKLRRQQLIYGILPCQSRYSTMESKANESGKKWNQALQV